MKTAQEVTGNVTGIKEVTGSSRLGDRPESVKSGGKRLVTSGALMWGRTERGIWLDKRTGP